MGKMKLGNNEASPKRLAKDITVSAGVNLESAITSREADLQSAQIESLYQAGQAMIAMSTLIDEGVHTSWL